MFQDETRNRIYKKELLERLGVRSDLRDYIVYDCREGSISAFLSKGKKKRDKTALLRKKAGGRDAVNKSESLTSDKSGLDTPVENS